MSEDSSLPKITIHPLALFQITQNATHLIQNSKTAERICGILVGRREEGKLTICQTSQIPFSEIVSRKDIGAKYLTEVDPDFVLLGWYSGMLDVPKDEEVMTHKQIAEDNINSLFMTIDFTKIYDDTTTNFPMNFYVLREELFVSVKHQFASVDIERIGVNEFVNSGTIEEMAKFEKDNLIKSINTLKEKTAVLIKYCKAVLEGKIQRDDEIIMKIAQICSSLPVSDNKVFEEEFKKEKDDAKLVLMLIQLMEASISASRETYNYVELLKIFQDKMRREEERKRMDPRMGDDMRYGGMMRNVMRSMGGYDDSDDDL